MRTLPPQNPAAALLALLVALTPACGGDQPPADSCRFNEDCATPIEYCEAFTGRCVRYECFEDQECSPTQRCSTLTNTCVPRRAPDLGIPPEPDDDMGPGPEMGPGSRPEMGSTNSEPDPFDRERPRILELDPAPGAELPEQGASIEITFSEAIDPLSLSEFTITMTDQLGRDVDLDIEPVGDPPTGARVAPVGALAPATSFELTISGMVRDLAMNTLGEKRTEPYFTRFVPDPARAAIARRWAPVIYQGLLARQRSRWRLDVPARVNFDGDWRASDNLEETLSVADYEPAVYYQVLETETQVFVFYVLYYPRRVDPAQQMSMPIEHEHDMTGAVFVIDRASDALVLVEGLRQEESTDQLIAYLSEEGGLSLPGEGRIQGSFDTSQLEQGRYPLYVPGGRHEACNWYDGQPNPPFDMCLHPSGQFPEGPRGGVILRPGDQGQPLEQATQDGQGRDQVTYALVPFAEAFWARRDSYGQEDLFTRSFTYRPEDDRPAGPTGGPALVLPRELSSEQEASFGKTPYRWLERPARTNAGQWLIDPAWSLPRRYALPDSMSWSRDYCDNLFLGVDERGARPACPEADP